MGLFEAGTVSEDRIGLLMTGGAEHSAEIAVDLDAPALTGEAG
jgi:hypothetical protein